MTVKGIAQYRKKLEAKRKELDAGLSKNQEAVKSYTGNDGIRDYADMAQRAYTKEFLYSLSNEERRVLGLVDEALSRINNKEYGICVVAARKSRKNDWGLSPGGATVSSARKNWRKGCRSPDSRRGYCPSVGPLPSIVHLAIQLGDGPFLML